MSNRTTPVLMVALVTSGALAACGGGEGSASAEPDRRKFQEAALEHAECMRSKGIDMPDPKPGQGIVLNGGEVDPVRLERAQKECEREVGKLPMPELSAKDQREFREAALEHARCMRGEGIEMPDPTFGADGGARIELKDAPPLDDPAFRAAEEKCREHLGRVAPGGAR